MAWPGRLPMKASGSILPRAGAWGRTGRRSCRGCGLLRLPDVPSTSPAGRAPPARPPYAGRAVGRVGPGLRRRRGRRGGTEEPRRSPPRARPLSDGGAPHPARSGPARCSDWDPAPPAPLGCREPALPSLRRVPAAPRPAPLLPACWSCARPEEPAARAGSALRRDNERPPPQETIERDQLLSK